MTRAPGRLDWTIALILVVGFGALYGATSAPSVLFSDAGELQTVAALGGVAHPPGYPTFVMIGQFVARWLPVEPARRITWMAVTFGALGVGGLALLVRRLGASRAAATGAAILFGGTFTYWWSAIGAEVYNLAVVMFLFALWRVTVALETRSARDGILAALLLGLTATGHLAFGPALLVLGVALVMHAPEGAPPAGFAIVLLGAFTLGLTPYLYVLVADHSGLPMNYLRSILEPAGHQFGIDPRTFSNPWVRLGYMFTGREATNLYTLHPRELLANAADALAIEGLFELGPIAAALALFGAVRLARRRDAIAFALLGAGAATLMFATVSAWARLRPVFLMPCTVVLSIAVGFGLDGTAARARGPGWARAAGIAALVGVAALAPHLLRLRAIARPIGPLGWHMRVKDGPMPAGPLPSFAGDWSARRYGEAVLRGIPPGALVVGRWYEITVLEYLLLAEGQRPDLTLEPYDGSHRVRLERWQDRHDLKRRPFVLLTRLPGLAAAFADADSIVVAPGQTLLVKRTRITAPTY